MLVLSQVETAKDSGKRLRAESKKQKTNLTFESSSRAFSYWPLNVFLCGFAVLGLFSGVRHETNIWMLLL